MTSRQMLHDRVTNDFGYHKATEQTGPMHDATRERFVNLAHWVVEHIPAGREQSLALTALQEAQMWANAAIACNLAPLEEAPADKRIREHEERFDNAPGGYNT